MDFDQETLAELMGIDIESLQSMQRKESRKQNAHRAMLKRALDETDEEIQAAFDDWEDFARSQVYDDIMTALWGSALNGVLDILQNVHKIEGKQLDLNRGVVYGTLLAITKIQGLYDQAKTKETKT